LKGASFGLVNLQVMHQLNISEILKGKKQQRKTKNSFHA